MATSTMKRDECERAIRYLCRRWREIAGFSKTPPEELMFSNFISWIRRNYPRYLKFHTKISVDYDAELWFAQEFNQI